MKHREMPRSLWPFSSVFVPLLVLFVSALNGPSPAEAGKQALSSFFSWGPGLVVWLEVLALNLLGLFWFMPVYRLYSDCVRSCEPPEGLVDIATRHLNGMRQWLIGSAILVFVAGKVGMLLLEGAFGFAGRLPELPFLLGEAAIGGFFVGTMLTLQFEGSFYDLRGGLLLRRGEASRRPGGPDSDAGLHERT